MGKKYKGTVDMYSYLIKNRKIEYEGFLSLETATIQVLDEAGKEKLSARRDRTLRPDSSAVLIYNRDRDAFVFTNQFRYPVSRETPHFMLEIPAGGIEPNESADAAAKREVREEVGYTCRLLEKIAAVYSSPGTTSECVHIFYAEVSDDNRVEKGGGKISESEIINIKYIDRKDLISNYLELTDAKSLIAVQWFIQHKAR